MVPRPRRLLGIIRHRARERGRVGAREHRQRSDPLRVLRREDPRELAAPVVADQVEALRAERAGDRERVGDEELDPVRVDPARARARRVAALVRRAGAVARGGERAQLRAPGVPRLREAVQQEHQLAAGRPRDVGREREPVRRDRHGFAAVPIPPSIRAASLRAKMRLEPFQRGGRLGSRNLHDAVAPAGAIASPGVPVGPRSPGALRSARLRRGLDRRALHVAVGAEPGARSVDRAGAAAHADDEARAGRAPASVPPSGRARVSRRLPRPHRAGPVHVRRRLERAAERLASCSTSTA